jgi:hypothetical protein
MTLTTMDIMMPPLLDRDTTMGMDDDGRRDEEGGTMRRRRRERQSGEAG